MGMILEIVVRTSVNIPTSFSSYVFCWPILETTNLGQALQCDISELWHFQEPCSERINDGGLKDISERDPVEETEKSLKRSLDQSLVGWRCSGLRCRAGRWTRTPHTSTVFKFLVLAEVI